MKKQYKVAIVGAGAMAKALGALLNERGHDVVIWSPSGKYSAEKIVINGVIESRGYCPDVAQNAEELVEQADVIMFALPANGYKSTMDAVAPYITQNQQVIVSAQLSFAAIYLERILAVRQIQIPIAAWNTTAVTAKQPALNILNISSIRDTIEVVALPSSSLEKVLDTCTTLFPNNFTPKGHILEITFSNLNPQVHMGMALCNITRMEQQEQWCQRKNTTPAVGRLIEALDEERLAIAKAYGCSVKSMMTNLNSSNEPPKTLSEIYQALHLQRPIWGPKTAQSRYVLEDVPYGLVVTAKLAQLSNSSAPLHEAGIALFSALYERNFNDENELIDAINLDSVIAKHANSAAN